MIIYVKINVRKRGETVKLVPVCSGSGGAGKSCVAAYSAVSLAKMKKKVLLIDAGAASGSLDVILGLQDSAVYNLGDVLSGACEPQRAILNLPGLSTLSLLPSGLGTAESDIRTKLSDFLRTIKNDYDYVFLDSCDLTSPELQAAFAVLLVTTPDTLSVRAAAQKNRELYDAGAKNVRLVINNVPARVSPMKSFRDFDEIVDQIGAQLIAVIPASQRLHHSANNGLPLPAESLTVQVFSNLAGRLRGKSEPLLIK